MNLTSKSSSFIFLISWLIYFLQLTSCVAQKSCKLDDIFNNECGENASCEEVNKNEGLCKCDFSFQLENGKCVPSSSEDDNKHSFATNGGSTAALWILIPCFILILAGAAIFLAKRLRLIEKLYQFRVRRYNTVFVTSLQDDDAPIT